jgi:hypothetical protein
MIRQIVDRCHIGDSDLAVIRYLISRMTRGYRTWKSLDRNRRRCLMREAVRIHHENQDLYKQYRF